jgi:hypothetical protein
VKTRFETKITRKNRWRLTQDEKTNRKLQQRDKSELK